MNATTMVLTTVLLLAVQVAPAEELPDSTVSARQQHLMIAPDEIPWGECPPFLPAGALCTTIQGDPRAPGALFTIRSKLPDGYRIPPHFHPADEHVTVISGTFKMAMGRTFDETALRPMSAGSFMLMPKGAPHFAQAQGETIVQVHAFGPLVFTYINPEDDPATKH